MLPVSQLGSSMAMTPKETRHKPSMDGIMECVGNSPVCVPPGCIPFWSANCRRLSCVAPRFRPSTVRLEWQAGGCGSKCPTGHTVARYPV